MDFGTSLQTCITKKYATFEGRASRSEFWYFSLFCCLLFFMIFLLYFSAVLPLPLTRLINLVVILGLFLPGLGVSVRRLHDIDRGGWWVLLNWLPPIVGAIILLCWFAQKGSAGPNRFGQDPLERA